MQVLNLHAHGCVPISMLSGLISRAGQSGTSPDPRHTLRTPPSTSPRAHEGTGATPGNTSVHDFRRKLAL